MVKITARISEDLAAQIGLYLEEEQSQNWTVEKLNNPTPPDLMGYFAELQDAIDSYAALRKVFAALPQDAEFEEVVEEDWKNAYKAYLKPWQCETLHWVPVWMKGEYKAPAGDKIFYFDAGMAFGTGDHPTTRLCALAMLAYIKENGGNVSKKSLIDAGCGSGILGLSAAMLGFGEVYGFDIEPEAVQVSYENAKLNGVNLHGVLFEEGGAKEKLRGKKADLLLANIQADILSKFADELIGAVAKGGTLVLSGILNFENEGVKKLFEEKIGARLISAKADFMGDWSSLVFKFA